MAVQLITFKVVGLSPLLCHNPAGSMRTKSEGVTVKKIPSPEDEAKAGLYRDDKGLYLPSIGFRNGILSACSGRKIGKYAANKMVSASLFCPTDRVYLIHPDTCKKLTDNDWEVSTMRAVVQRQGILRSRPMFAVWATKVSFDLDLEFVTRQMVSELFALAGKMIGIGDYRVEKKGPYGRYSVTMES